MRVLVAHTKYRLAGGEDSVVRAETRLLREAGHGVELLELSSESLDDLTLMARCRIALHYADHGHGRAIIRNALARFKPDIVHFHNLYPLLGPGAIAEADAAGYATVQTLHNYRFSCLKGTHFRDGAMCWDCSPARRRAGVRYGCYRSSRLQSVVAAQANGRQWKAFVAESRPTMATALTGHIRDTYVGYGADASRIIVKPNSVEPSTLLGGGARQGVLFAGRLSEEKGIISLVRAWPQSGPALLVAGDGPLAGGARRVACPNVKFLGFLSKSDLRQALASARALVVPSLGPEGLPLVALEALAEGTPVVTFRGGGREEVLEPLSLRLAVEPGDFPSLCVNAQTITCSPDWPSLSKRCVREFWRTYSPRANLARLENAYDRAVSLKRGLPA